MKEKGTDKRVICQDKTIEPVIRTFRSGWTASRLSKTMLEIVQLSAARARATDEAGAAIARQLNGPLTALLLYMNEIKQHSHQFSQAPAIASTCSRSWRTRFSKPNASAPW